MHENHAHTFRTQRLGKITNVLFRSAAVLMTDEEKDRPVVWLPGFSREPGHTYAGGELFEVLVTCRAKNLKAPSRAIARTRRPIGPGARESVEGELDGLKNLARSRPPGATERPIGET